MGIDWVDVRRITGPTLELDGPGAIAELHFAGDVGDVGDVGEDPAAILTAIAGEARALVAAVGWPPSPAHLRRFRRRAGGEGATLAISAPIDGVDAAVELLEIAVARIRASGSEAAPAPPADSILTLRQAIAREAQPALVALADEARRRGLPTLIDDDALTIGHGPRAHTWPRGQLPTIAEVPWSALGSIPIALVTGTNGKTTSARVLAHIARCGGVRAGNTSTDGIAIDGVLIEEGDWTGPAATRILLRRPELELAVLEVARGGILRRGLAVTRADVALITNVAADHLGEYGVEDEATMAAVKVVPARIVHAAGRVILGADSPPLRAVGPFTAPIVWFSLTPDGPGIAAHTRAGGEAWYAAEGQIVRARGDREEAIVAVTDVPFTLGGAARYNVQNALGAAAAAAALGLDHATIARGLATFSSSAAQNPGRINRFDVAGVQVILDFAHNVAGITALGDVLAALRGPGRLAIAVGMAGDRSDDDLQGIAAAIVALRPERVIVRELHDYLRGRAPGEVPRVLQAALLRAGLAAAAIEVAAGEADSLARALAWARAGDLVAVLAHTERDEAHGFLQERGAIAL